jgi:hypothetical protein
MLFLEKPIYHSDQCDLVDAYWLTHLFCSLTINRLKVYGKSMERTSFIKEQDSRTCTFMKCP